MGRKRLPLSTVSIKNTDAGYNLVNLCKLINEVKKQNYPLSQTLANSFKTLDGRVIHY